jgi:hypothetical protein
VTFLVRTSPPPVGAFARRLGGAAPGRHVGQRSVLIGLAGYMFASPLVDLDGFINQVVGVASVPSIALRVILGAVLVWLIPARNGLQASRRFWPSAGPPMARLRHPRSEPIGPWVWSQPGRRSR